MAYLNHGQQQQPVGIATLRAGLRSNHQGTWSPSVPSPSYGSSGWQSQYQGTHGSNVESKTGPALAQSAFLRGSLNQVPSPYLGTGAAGKLSLRGAGQGLSATLNRTAGKDFGHAQPVAPAPGVPTGTVRMSGRLYTSVGTPFDSGVTYQYQTGLYTSKTGLPPMAYKPWSTEHKDEYREPQEVRETLQQLTHHYGTADALKTSRFQLNGYPPSRTLLASSLTQRLQNAPTYETRVIAY